MNAEEQKDINQPSMPPVRYSVTEASIAKLREKYSEIPDVTEKEGYQLVKAGIAEVRGLRTNIETRRKELKADALAYGRKVDGLAKSITEELLAIEAPMKTAKEAEDKRVAEEKERIRKAEEDRISRIKTRIDDMKEVVVRFGMDSPADDIRNEINRIKGIDTEVGFDEFADAASAAKNGAIVNLGDLLDRRTRFESQQAEMEAARKKREEEEQKLAEERARLDAERKARDEELERERQAQQDALEAEREALRKEREAMEEERRQREQESRQAAEKEEAARLAELERLRAEKAEQDRLEAEQAAEREAAERAERMRPQKDRVVDWAKKLRFIDGPDGITDDALLAEVRIALGKLEALSKEIVGAVNKL